MKRLLGFAIGTLLALQPVSAAAQVFNGTPFDVEYLRFIAGSGQGGAYGVQVGPYTGQFLGNTSSTVLNQSQQIQDQVLRSTTTLPFALYCVDFQHSANNSNGLVTVTSLSMGTDWGNSNTRLQDFGSYQRGAYLSSLFDSWETYESQLEALYGGTNFTKANVWGGLHAAIWGATTGPTGSPSLTVNAALAMQFFDGLANQNAGDYDTSGWYVLSEANNLGGSYSGQEFLMRIAVPVPEPSTLLLMMTGLFLLIGANRRRWVELEG